MLERDTAAETRCGADLTLVQRLRGGDTAALEILMEQHAPRVYRVAYGIMQNVADAEEVVQDVFLTLFRKIHTFEERAALGSWLYRVATNAALVKRRGRRSDREVPLESLVPTFLPDGHRAGEREFLLRDWSRSPEATLLSQETREIVQRAISVLPDRYRAVLVLRDIEGLGNEEVAAIVGDSVAAVKSRLHRARMVLREALTQFFGSGSENRSEAASRSEGTTPRADISAGEARDRAKTTLEAPTRTAPSVSANRRRWAPHLTE